MTREWRKAPNHFKFAASWVDSPGERRLLELQNRKPLKRAIQKLMKKPLRRKLPAKDRTEVFERVRSGRRQMSRMGLGL